MVTTIVELSHTHDLVLKASAYWEVLDKLLSERVDDRWARGHISKAAAKKASLWERRPYAENIDLQTLHDIIIM